MQVCGSSRGGYHVLMDDPTTSAVQRFEFAWEPRYQRAGLVFGVTPRRAWVEVTEDELRVRYGWWSLRSPLGNVTGLDVSGGYSFVKTAGPPHLSFSDRGISFATNSHEGVCVSFRDPVPGIDPTGTIKHPGATLTVADVDGLAEALGLPVR